jgi:hypothetical protein
LIEPLGGCNDQEIVQTGTQVEARQRITGLHAEAVGSISREIRSGPRPRRSSLLRSSFRRASSDGPRRLRCRSC